MQHRLLFTAYIWLVVVTAFMMFLPAANVVGQDDDEPAEGEPLSQPGDFQIMFKGDRGLSPEVNYQNPPSQKKVETTSSDLPGPPGECPKQGRSEQLIDTWDMRQGFATDWSSGVTVSIVLWVEHEDDTCPEQSSNQNDFRFDLFHGDEIISQGLASNQDVSGTEPTLVQFDGDDLDSPGFFQSGEKLRIDVYWSGFYDLIIYFDKDTVDSGILMSGDPLQVMDFRLSEGGTDLEMFYKNAFSTRQEAVYANFSVAGNHVDVTPRHSKDIGADLLKMVWTWDIKKGDSIAGEITYTTNNSLNQGMKFNTEFAGASSSSDSISVAQWVGIGIGAFFGIAYLVFWIYIMLWTYRDATELGINPWLWVGLIFVLTGAGWIPWLIYIFAIRGGGGGGGAYYEEVPAV